MPPIELTADDERAIDQALASVRAGVFEVRFTICLRGPLGAQRLRARAELLHHAQRGRQHARPALAHELAIAQALEEAQSRSR